VVVEPHEIGQAGLGVVALSEQTLLVMDVVAEAQEPDVRRQSAGKPLAATSVNLGPSRFTSHTDP
jgi:hypothetical protein